MPSGLPCRTSSPTPSRWLDRRAAFKAVNRAFVMMARELDLIGGEVVATDGAFFHGDASRGSIKTHKRLKAQLAEINQDIEDYGAALAAGDAAEAPVEAGAGAAADAGAAMTALMEKHATVTADLAKLTASGETQLSQTDPDARLLTKNGRVVAGYKGPARGCSTTPSGSIRRAPWRSRAPGSAGSRRGI